MNISVALLFLVSSMAFADNVPGKAVDLRPSFFRPQSSRSSNPNVSTIEIGGMRYVRIQSGNADLILPRLNNYSAKDFEQAFCAPKEGGSSETKTLPVAKTDLKLSQTFSAYAGLIAETYKSKCIGAPKDGAKTMPINPELGVTYQPKENGVGSSYDVYVQPNQVGVRTNF